MTLRRYSTLGSFTLTLVVGVAAVSVSCGPTETTCEDGIGCVGDAGSTSAGKAGSSGASTTGGESGGPTGGNAMTGGSSHAGDGGSGDGGSSIGGEGGSSAEPCNGACEAPTPVCKEATDTCVECLAPTDCASGDENLCDTTSNTCVECLAPADCTSAIASRCDGGTCVQCEHNDDCSHIAGKGVCDAGECVQCTSADESACAGKSCNPATNACTNTNAGSVGTCKPCLADSECTGGNMADPTSRCVPMEFNGTPRQGGFCLRRVAKTCSRPFQTPISVSSLSGAASEQYCGIDQESTRCEAVLDLIADSACADGMDSSCGCERDVDGNCISSGTGGLCETVGVNANRCTYTCGTVGDCPTGKTCTVDDPYCH